MLLLNAAALAGLTSLIVPILLHLQKRRKPKEIAWAAMRFLQCTLASRRRGVTLENLLLLFCRCLLLALFVLAMARPVIDSPTPRPILMLASGVGAIFAAVVAVVWPSRAGKIGAAVTAAALLLVALATSSLSNRGLLSSRDDCDLAIVLDGTLSMTVGRNGKTNFENAISEARSLIDQLSGDSTVSLVLAGPVPQVIEASPFRNLPRAVAELARLKPVGGGGNLQSAISRAKWSFSQIASWFPRPSASSGFGARKMRRGLL